MNEIEKFFREVHENIKAMTKDNKFNELSLKWITTSVRHKYSYNFTWLGRPIIQYPQDIVAMQEIIWEVKPELIIETGIAHGGSLIFFAAMLELVAACAGSEGEVLGVDIEIRPHNRKAMEEHPMFKRITMIEGSSTDPNVVQQVYEFAKGKSPVMVVLDSLHTHEHVLQELKLYSPLVTKGSYLVVFDTLIEDLPEDLWPNRPWGKGNNPKTAVWEFLKTNDRFMIDKEIEHKLLITVAPDGYLKCVKD